MLGRPVLVICLIAFLNLHGVAQDTSPPDQDAIQAITSEKEREEESAKARIMQSDEWRKAEAAFQEWLSMQEVYNGEEIAKLRADLKEQIAKMSAIQLEAFLYDMQQKLSVLLSDEARDARTWVANYMSVLAEKKIDEIKQELPDIRTASSRDLEDVLVKIQNRRRSNQRRGTFENKTRQTTASAAIAESVWQRQTYERSRSRAQSAVAKQASTPTKVVNHNRGGASRRGGAWGGWGGGRVYGGFRW